MKKVQEYKGKEIIVCFDASRCIHSGECVRGLPEVFLKKVEGPWIQPDAADVNELTKLIETCPSGALCYEKNDQTEAMPEINRIKVESDGPLTIYADYSLNGIQAESPRATLCRCGASKVKPYCDGSHEEVGFSDKGEVTAFNPDDKQESGIVEIKALKNGPLYLLGPHCICDAAGSIARVCYKITLCRCGVSKVKPYCDGSHAGIGFKAD